MNLVSALSELDNPGSPFVYATLVSYDLATDLATVEVLGTEITGVAKLRHVDFGGTWELIEDRFVTGGVASTTMNIPAGRLYDEFDISATGNASGSNYIALRVNNLSGATDYNRAVYMRDSGAFVNTVFGTGDQLLVGWLGSQLGGFTTRLRKSNTSTNFWVMTSLGFHNNSPSVFHGTGRLAVATSEVTSLRFAGNTTTFTNFRVCVRGFRPAVAAGATLLCVRSNQVPLTIVGVLSGDTI